MEPIHRRLVLCLTCGVFLLAATTAWAQGFVGPPAPLDPSLGFIDTYRQLRGIWFFDLFPAAQDLFWTLATLELVLSCILWMAAWFHIDTLAQHLFKKILFISVGYAILLHADTWIPDIIDSFLTLGQQVSGVPLTPSFVLAQGTRVAVTMLKAEGVMAWFTNITGAIIATLSAILVFVAYALIAMELAVTLVESYVVTSAGVFLLAFVPFRGTAALTERFLGYVIAVGIKLFMVYVLVGAGAQLAPAWAAYINSGNIFDLNIPLNLAAAAFVFFMLAHKIPSLAGSLAMGTVGMTLHDITGAASSAIRVAVAGVSAPAVVGAAAGVVRGAVGIGQAAAQANGGGVRSIMSGTRAGVSALSREAAAATVPRLQRAGARLQQQAREAQARTQTGTP
jgi:type IV secretion system protein TrbL